MTKPLKTLAQELMLHIETVTPPFSGRGETALAALVLPLTFIYKILDSLYGKNAITGQPWPYILLLSVFTAIAFSSIFWLATPTGERWLPIMLTKKWRPLVAALPALHVGPFLSLAWGLGLPQLGSHALAMIGEPWSRLPLPLFLCFAAVILSVGFWGGLTLANRQAIRRSVNQPEEPAFGLREIGCVLLATLPFLLLQEQLPVLWCFTTPVAVTVMVYATELGREFFCFSFVPRSLKEAGFILLLMASGLLLFLLVTLVAGTITYTGGLWRSGWFVLYDSLFTWLLVVGISEEIIFRCGVLTLIVGLLAKNNHPRLSAVILTSFLFALAHLFRGATLIFLALLASLLYGLAFVAGKSLFGPVLLHGLLNVLILMNFHLSDFK